MFPKLQFSSESISEQAPGGRTRDRKMYLIFGPGVYCSYMNLPRACCAFSRAYLNIPIVQMES